MASLHNTAHYLLIKFRLTQILYTTFKQHYISFINLLLFIKTKLKCNKIKVLTLTKKIQTMSKDFYKTYISPYGGIIIKICKAYSNSQEDYEDYYQEVCLQIWKSRENFKNKSKWSTWVYRISLNVCLSLIRKQKKHNNTYGVEQNYNQLSNQSDSNEGSKDYSNDISRLYEEIKKLSEIDRAIILLYLEKKTYREISQIIGINSNSIGVKITRIKKQLKKQLNG
jgi:RNA polymerase sigma-70 factor, ECF subfamily